MQFKFYDNEVKIVYSWRDRINIFFKGEKSIKYEGTKHLCNNIFKLGHEIYQKCVSEEHKKTQSHGPEKI